MATNWVINVCDWREKGNFLFLGDLPQKRCGFCFAPKIDQTGEQVVRFRVHEEVIFPTRLEQIFISLGRIFLRTSLLL